MDQDDARQLIHLTYGYLLNAKDKNGKYLFRERFFQPLTDFEEEYWTLLEKHIGKHLTSLGVEKEERHEPLTQETINQIVNSSAPQRLSLTDRPPITDDHAAHILQLTQWGQTSLGCRPSALSRNQWSLGQYCLRGNSRAEHPFCSCQTFPE